MSCSMDIETVCVFMIVTDVQLATCVRARRIPRIDLLGERIKGEPSPIGARFQAENQVILTPASPPDDPLQIRKLARFLKIGGRLGADGGIVLEKLKNVPRG